MVILVRRLHFIDYLGQEAPFCWVNLRGCWSSFSFMSKTMLGIGWSFILWSMLYLEGWSFRSSYFIGVALLFHFNYPEEAAIEIILE